jgi:hypothetical protein
MTVDISRLKRFKQSQFMIHLVDAKLNKNHLTHWISVLEDCGYDFSILVRDEKSFKEISKIYSNHQVLYAQTPVDVETVVTAQPKLEIVFFPLNAAKNIHLLRFNHLKHIFIGTKHSDQLSELNKSYRAYDEIWVSGQYMVDKYNETFENLGHLSIKKVGKPQLKDLIQNSFKTHMLDNILYLPSKKDSIDTSSYIMGDILLNIKNKIKKSVSLILENQTLNQDILELKSSYSLNLSIFNNTTMLDTLAINSDIIITDIDRVNVYLLAYNKPIFVYIRDKEDITHLKLDIPADALYFYANSDELISGITNVYDNDILSEKREYYSKYYLGKDEILNDIFCKTLKDSLG